MLKRVLFWLGWLLVVVTLFNIGVKLFAADDLVRRYAGSGRNLDAPFLGLAVGLVFLSLSAILYKLDKLLSNNSTLNN